MKVHLVKLAVGIRDLNHLKSVQIKKINNSGLDGNPQKLCHITKNTPRRAKELLNGGSIYWVIKRVIQARQFIIGIEPVLKNNGQSACAVILDPILYQTIPRTFRPFQGWRYLAPSAAPDDIPDDQQISKDFPHSLAKELQNLGLI